MVRPLVDGKPGEVLSSKTIPMMVLAKTVRLLLAHSCCSRTRPGPPPKWSLCAPCRRRRRSKARAPRQQFLAIAKYSDGTERDVTAEAEWRLSNPALAKFISLGARGAVGGRRSHADRGSFRARRPSRRSRSKMRQRRNRSLSAARSPASSPSAAATAPSATAASKARAASSSPPTRSTRRTTTSGSPKAAATRCSPPK